MFRGNLFHYREACPFIHYGPTFDQTLTGFVCTVCHWRSPHLVSLQQLYSCSVASIRDRNNFTGIVWDFLVQYLLNYINILGEFFLRKYKLNKTTTDIIFFNAGRWRVTVTFIWWHIASSYRNWSVSDLCRFAMRWWVWKVKILEHFHTTYNMFKKQLYVLLIVKQHIPWQKFTLGYFVILILYITKRFHWGSITCVLHNALKILGLMGRMLEWKFPFA
jgi:hypothetical protein